MPLEFVKREEWTKFREEKPDKILHPAYCVWYTVTCTRPCNDGESCIQRTKGLLREHRLDFKRKDIAYNFLIGDDGKVIEARGWFDAPDLPVQFLSLKHQSIYIAFIGWYKYLELPKDLYIIADELVKYGVENKYIKEKYIMNDLISIVSRRRCVG
ncbi:peptidoglycan recognition protein 1-like isoform X2 [Macrosteles quadrilineatus]|uniref:peptidoglycan recognition protein 1-like isoform X2 n=1 Tax=Macrosteles quadrilineatus TaxID=74068 RepID=UPI0023E2F199|nr:peptidoglycan recognition protein 1-like isoform X2 [Macrosteles quadrilineatus]